MKNEKIKNILLSQVQQDYKKFTASLIPNIDNVLGVRLPFLRKLAKEIHNSADWQNFVNSKKEEFMEEVMLKGMIIGLIKEPPEIILNYVREFVPKINNWAVCDTFCSSLKFTNKNKEIVWKFMQPYLKSDKEYEIRFGVVMVLNYFVEEKYIEEVLQILDKIKHEGYYSKMAVAWALSICFIKQQQVTFEYFKNSNLDDWTFNKALQKCRESYRVSAEMKNALKSMKR